MLKLLDRLFLGLLRCFYARAERSWTLHPEAAATGWFVLWLTVNCASLFFLADFCIRMIFQHSLYTDRRFMGFTIGMGIVVMIYGEKAISRIKNPNNLSDFEKREQRRRAIYYVFASTVVLMGAASTLAVR